MVPPGTTGLDGSGDDDTWRDLQALPKAHLHLHFTGSMRHATLVELAARDGIVLPDALVEHWPDNQTRAYTGHVIGPIDLEVWPAARTASS